MPGIEKKYHILHLQSQSSTLTFGPAEVSPGLCPNLFIPLMRALAQHIGAFRNAPKLQKKNG